MGQHGADAGFFGCVKGGGLGWQRRAVAVGETGD